MEAGALYSCAKATQRKLIDKATLEIRLAIAMLHSIHHWLRYETRGVCNLLSGLARRVAKLTGIVSAEMSGTLITDIEADGRDGIDA